MAVSGWDNEILARKFSKIDCRLTNYGMVEVKNFHFLKRLFLTKKGKWFFVTLRGGRGGVKASVTFVTKKMVFFLKAFLTKVTVCNTFVCVHC